MKIKIKVTPRAKQERIEQEKDLLRVYVNAPQQEGRANKRVIEMLARYYKVKKRQVSIVKGSFSREKVIEIG